MRTSLCLFVCLAVAWPGAVAGAEGPAEDGWRTLPLLKDGKVDPSWAQVGWGGFAALKDGLRTDSDEHGMGLLLYTKEKFGNCQIRVVYRSKDAKSNSGVFIRIDDGILERVKERPAAVKRDRDGKLSAAMLAK